MSIERDSEERERVLRQLLTHAKPRPQPPPDDTEEIRRAVLAEWEAATTPRIWRNRAAIGAVAAAALVAAVVYVGSGGEPTASGPSPLIANVERVQGIVTTENGVRISAGSGIQAGAQIESGDGQAALRLANGGSLRLAPRSRLVLESTDEAELLAGAVYFDSEQRRPTDFVVTTKLGQIRDVGTQFLVRLDDQQLAVGVREGRVTLMRGADADMAGVGESLVASQAGNGLRREPIETFGADWEWAERLAPPFDINGRTFGEFIAWFEAQTGRTVVFADAAVERELRSAVLTGSPDFPPLQKLSAVLEINNLTYTLDGNRVVIRR